MPSSTVSTEAGIVAVHRHQGCTDTRAIIKLNISYGLTYLLTRLTGHHQPKWPILALEHRDTAGGTRLVPSRLRRSASVPFVLRLRASGKAAMGVHKGTGKWQNTPVLSGARLASMPLSAALSRTGVSFATFDASALCGNRPPPNNRHVISRVAAWSMP